jgi:hypothetical protein
MHPSIDVNEKIRRTRGGMQCIGDGQARTFMHNRRLRVQAAQKSYSRRDTVSSTGRTILKETQGRSVQVKLEGIPPVSRDQAFQAATMAFNSQRLCTSTPTVLRTPTVHLPPRLQVLDLIVRILNLSPHTWIIPTQAFPNSASVPKSYLAKRRVMHSDAL